MTHPSTLRLIAFAAVAACTAAPALAQDSQYASPYPYVGLSLGQSRAQINQPRISNSLVGAGLATTGISTDDSDTAYKVFGGYQFNRYIALEGGFFSLGKFGFTTTTNPAGTLTGQTKVQGLNLDLVGTLPLVGELSALARVGAQYARVRGEYTGTGAVPALNLSPSNRETNAKVGLGLQYAFSPGFTLRTEVERYRISDAMGQHDHVNVASVSLVFPFGQAPTSRRQAYVAPAYVPTAQTPALTPAATPAPLPAAPVAAVAAAPLIVAAAPMPARAPTVMPAQPRRVSFSADSLFGFDDATVRADSKPALDTFARELTGTQFDSIRVEGHTDRLGSAAYNQRLSMQRAQAVKAYLVGSDGLDGARIAAVGKGEEAPVTKAEDCKGQQANAKLIACLQPDRRVEVEVTGTR